MLKISAFCLVKSKKLISACSSFSIVNFVDGCKLLNSLSVQCLFCFGRILCRQHV
jgi:hypothetical protein